MADPTSGTVAGPPTDPLVPFTGYRTEVRPEWLDRNGHLHDANYAVVFSDANEELFEALGLSWGYRDQTGASFYTVETHIRFLAECTLGQVLTAATTLVSATPRKMHLSTELTADGGRLVATAESYYLHVDAGTGRVTSLSDERYEPVRRLAEAHAALPRPEHLGRGVAP